MIKELAEWIAAQTGMVIGTNLIVGHTWPTHQNRCCLLKEHTGSALYPDLPDRADFMLQVLSRGDTYFNARDDAYTIYDAIYKNRKGPIDLGTPGGNLVTNGNMESWTGGVLDDWTLQITAPSTITEGISYDGSRCANLNRLGARVRFLQGVGGLVIGKKYQISWWYKSSLIADALQYNILQNGKYLSSNSLWGNASVYIYMNIDNQWRQWSQVFESIAVNTIIYFENPNPDSTLSLDNIVIQSLDEYVAMTCHATTTPQYLGEDDRKRHLFSTNYRFQIRDYNNG